MNNYYNLGQLNLKKNKIQKLIRLKKCMIHNYRTSKNDPTNQFINVNPSLMTINYRFTTFISFPKKELINFEKK